MGKVSKKITLESIIDVSGLNSTEKKDLKDELGEFIVDMILADASKQRSSVSGQLWKRLSPDYKKFKKKEGGSGKADMELYGDMLDALDYKRTTDGIEIGVFIDKQAKKVDGHSHTGVFGKSKLPKRQMIPGEKENFRPGIMKEVTLLAQEVIDGIEA